MGWVRLDCDLGTVCACANVVMTRWHAFRLSTSSCLTSVKATTQCVVTYNFFGIAQNRLVNQQETLACVRKVLRCPFLYFCFLLQMSINFSIFFLRGSVCFLYFFWNSWREIGARACAQAKISLVVHTPRLTAVLILNEVERLRESWVFAHKDNIVTLVTSQREFFQTGGQHANHWHSVYPVAFTLILVTFL